MEKKKMFLVDGHSYIYRAYYAIKDLKNSKGFPTNAIYGFYNILNRIIKSEKPDYLAVAFDVKGPTFRHEKYLKYKIHRKPMPDDLVAQLPWIKEILKKLDIPICEFKGYEADDVIASLVEKFKADNIRILIASNDKDILQLVCKNVNVYRYYNGTKYIYGKSEVKEKYGVFPEQIPDFLALKGDKSDNIPGVPGIGKKYSSGLIAKYGGVEKIISNKEKIKSERLRKAIKEYKKEAVFGKELTLLKRNIEIFLNLEDLILNTENRKKLIPIFEELEFDKLVEKYLNY